MAVILVEGFDHWAAADASQKFWNGYIPGFVRLDTGRNPTGKCIVVQTLASLSRQLPSSYSELIVGASIKLSGLTSHFMSILSPTGVVASLGISGGYLTLTDSAANSFSGTTLIPDTSWFSVEVKIAVGTSGSFEVHLNDAAEISGTGNFGTDDINKVLFTHSGFSEGATTRVDDVYVADTTGSSPQNDFLGDVEVKTLYPAADGHYSDWTPLVGSDHWLMVNESPADGDGSFNYDATPGDKDSFVMQAIGVASTIYAAQLNISARKGDAGLRQIQSFVRQSGTDYSSSTFTLSTDYLFYSWLLQQDPTSSDWTPSTLNGDEFGVDVLA